MLSRAALAVLIAAAVLALQLPDAAHGIAVPAPAPARPTLKRSFRAHQWTASIASGEGWTNSSGPVGVNADIQEITQQANLKDGRETLLKFKYGNSSKAGVYSLQPFFQYRVCFLYPLPGVSTHSKIESFDEALGVVWCPNGENSNDGCMEVYNRTTFAGRATIGGTPCQLWDYKNNSPPVTVQEVKFCVGDDGSLVSVNLTFSGLQKLNNDTFHNSAFSQNVFSNVTTAPSDTPVFDLPEAKGCVDLRPMESDGAVADHDDTLLNDPARIARINEQASGWTAGPQEGMDSATWGSLKASKLGLHMAALQLPLPSKQHLLDRGEFSGSDIPEAFDAREKWGSACPSIAYVRNQGRCGSCFAFAATTAFTDRVCIKNSAKYRNLTLSPEFMVDCDKNDSGCSGGFLDNAWKFLVGTGLPTEKCDPYEHCPWPGNPGCIGPPPPPPPTSCSFKNNTDYAPTNKSIMTIGMDSPSQCCERCGETANCVLGVYQPPGLCHLKAKEDIAGGAVARPGFTAGGVLPPPPPPGKPTCRAVCKDGTPLNTVKAKTAYAVGAPGDTTAMQRELMAHGPFEVGFEVFSDFGSYTNGTYVRTKSATGPGGGHAVKLVGWGVDANGVDYWTIANSWSGAWGGLGGFFRMRRGTNECGIETTSAAGLP